MSVSMKAYGGKMKVDEGEWTKAIIIHEAEWRWKYRVAWNFRESLFLQIGDFLCLRELIFAIWTGCFFLLGTNVCVFRKHPVPSIDNIFVFIEYVQ